MKDQTQLWPGKFFELTYIIFSNHTICWVISTKHNLTFWKLFWRLFSPIYLYVTFGFQKTVFLLVIINESSNLTLDDNVDFTTSGAVLIGCSELVPASVLHLLEISALCHPLSEWMGGLHFNGFFCILLIFLRTWLTLKEYVQVLIFKSKD